MSQPPIAVSARQLEGATLPAMKGIVRQVELPLFADRKQPDSQHHPSSPSHFLAVHVTCDFAHGLFSISLFGNKAYTNGTEEAAPVHLKKGETLRLRYGMYFHDGETKEGNVAGEWDQFVKTTAETPAAPK